MIDAVLTVWKGAELPFRCLFRTNQPVGLIGTKKKKKKKKTRWERCNFFPLANIDFSVMQQSRFIQVVFYRRLSYFASQSFVSNIDSKAIFILVKLLFESAL